MYYCFSFRVVPGCRRRHLFVDGAVRGVYTSLCVYFSMHISMVAPYTLCEAKKKDNSNNYNDNKQEEWKKRSI